MTNGDRETLRTPSASEQPIALGDPRGITARFKLPDVSIENLELKGPNMVLQTSVIERHPVPKAGKRRVSRGGTRGSAEVAAADRSGEAEGDVQVLIRGASTCLCLGGEEPAGGLPQNVKYLIALLDWVVRKGVRREHRRNEIPEARIPGDPIGDAIRNRAGSLTKSERNGPVVRPFATRRGVVNDMTSWLEVDQVPSRHPNIKTVDPAEAGHGAIPKLPARRFGLEGLNQAPELGLPDPGGTVGAGPGAGGVRRLTALITMDEVGVTSDNGDAVMPVKKLAYERDSPRDLRAGGPRLKVEIDQQQARALLKHDPQSEQATGDLPGRLDGANLLQNGRADNHKNSPSTDIQEGPEDRASRNMTVKLGGVTGVTMRLLEKQDVMPS